MNEQKAKFGFKYIADKTPIAAKWVFRAVLYTAATVNIVLAVIVEIPPHVSEIVGKYSLYAVTLTHAFSKMWGIPLDDDTRRQEDFYKNIKA